MSWWWPRWRTQWRCHWRGLPHRGAALAAATCNRHDGQIGNREPVAPGWRPEQRSELCHHRAGADRSSATLGEYIIFTGTATDPDVPSESLVTQWSFDKDGPLGTGSINSAGELTLPYADLSADIHTITLEVSDEIEACALIPWCSLLALRLL